MSGGVEIEQRPGLDNVLVATQAYTPGATVVQEKPLLHVPGLKPSNPLYQPLQAYFQQHQMPPSVVLKILAYVAAGPDTQASVLRCFCPDTTAHANALVVRQARAFATCLLQHPPVPEFAEWAAQQAEAAAADTAQQAAFDVLVRVWLIWVMNGHSFNLKGLQGSALFEYGSKLTHTCACPNTVYRTATGDIASVVESVDGSSSSSGGGLQQPGAAAVPAAGGEAAAAAGAHLALAPISPGELLTTNYLGMGHKRLMITPARQKHLQDKFLFKCTCHRCLQEPDLARGIPCPSCSGPFRSEDRLLQEQEALAGCDIGSSLVSSSSSGGGGDGGGGGGGEDSNGEAGLGGPGSSSDASADNSSSSSRCGYIYCDMAELLAGGGQPWKCDVCGVAVANDAAELWGRFYTKAHATVEGDMEGWVLKLDASMDSAPLVRDPAVLHQRVMGVLRLLGPRHWASWRLLLLGVELHCGALEEAAIKAQMQQSKARRAAADAAKAAADAVPDSATGSSTTEPAPDAAAAATITQQAVWIVRYCKQLWTSVSGKYGEVEAGQVLGYHLSEACQVLLTIASSPRLLPQQTTNALVDVALQLQALVLPGVRSIMGPAYNPLAGLLGADSLAAVGGSVEPAAVAAAVRRQQRTQADEASKMLTLVQELKRMAAREEGLI